MNPVNWNYGQDFILRLACGMPLPAPPIWGVLQHAWMPDSPMWAGEVQPRLWPFFVYSAHNRDEMLALGFGAKQAVVDIGSPFLYLQQLLGSSCDRRPEQPASQIFYPRHGFGGVEHVRRHRLIAEDLLEREGPDVTVCHHFHNYANHAIRSAYSDLGFRVVTHGWGGDPLFYVRQLIELRRHTEVISNKVSTAMWHGGSLGLKMRVGGLEFPEPGDPPDLANEVQAQRWPDLFDAGLSGPEGVEKARAELGAASLRQPAELARLLGWVGPVRLVGRVLDPVVRARQWLQDLTVARSQGGWAPVPPPSDGIS